MPTDPAPPARSGNRILASLPEEEYERLLPHLKAVSLPAQEVLFRPDETAHYVYFPETAVISMQVMLLDGSTAEVGMVGNRGMAGLRAYLGVSKATHTALVLIPGEAVRMDADVLKDECAQCAVLNDLMLRYTQALLIQSQQLTVCTRHHTLEARLCRWLLMIQDRTPLNDLPLTHEFISQMLGMRREGVTVAARRLQQEGLIGQTRGIITIADRRAMEEAACECYRVIREAYSSLLPPQTFM